MSRTPPEILIHDATVLTVDESGHLYRNGTVVVDDGTIETARFSCTATGPAVNSEEVCDRAETAIKRFGDEMGWKMDIGRSDPPSDIRTARDPHKRGPAHLVAHLDLQRVKGRL
jgi:hypothetical protein